MTSPYAPALDFLSRHSDTGASIGLAKLILSLWNDEAAFSYRECVRSFDPELDALALKIIEHFHRHGEDQYLREAGEWVYQRYTGLWELGYAGTEAKRALMQQREVDRV